MSFRLRLHPALAYALRSASVLAGVLLSAAPSHAAYIHSQYTLGVPNYNIAQYGVLVDYRATVQRYDEGENWTQLSFLYPATWTGVSAFNVPGWACRDKTAYHNGYWQIMCDPHHAGNLDHPLPRNSARAIQIVFHANARCASSELILANTFNAIVTPKKHGGSFWQQSYAQNDRRGGATAPYGGWVPAGVVFPACPRPSSSSSSSRSSSSSSSSSSNPSPITACTLRLFGHPQVNRGGTLPYVATVRNTGASAASLPPVTFSLPDNTSLNTAQSPSFCTQQGNRISCTIPASVAPGTEYNFVYFLTIDSAIACQTPLEVSGWACNTDAGPVKTLVTCSSSSSSSSSSTPVPHCRDGIDNDGDGYIDFAQDGGCTSPDDPSEDGVTQCSDKIDNDHDGWIDVDDMDCQSAQDNSESPSTPTFQCNDRQDNDGDGRIDFGSDFQCSSPYDDSEQV